MRKTTKDFIKEAKSVHGNTYKYDKVLYVTRDDKVIITCKKHGDFEQTPSNHLSNHGCMPCCKERAAKIHAKSLLDFLKEAKLIHGDTYNYDKVKYVNCKTKVIITCKKHGDFEQAPIKHLSNHGCQKCSGRNKTTKDFVMEAKSVHGDKYKYNKSLYVKSTEKVIITCKKHGDFEQAPRNHIIRKQGCPECSITGFDVNKKAILYVLDIVAHDSSNQNFVGYGITNKYANRLTRHKFNLQQTHSIKKIYKFKFDDGSEALRLEKLLKKKRKFRANIGIEGFKTESFVYKCRKAVLNYIESRM